jgi:maltose alpha-D-glucosyltransferase/alpha-amylase
MAENLDVPGRLSVRTPMQWTDERNAGFSPAPTSRLPRPVGEGRFGPMAVNVAEQRRDPNSLLNWFERVIRRRRETPEFGWGAVTLLDTGGDNAVLAHRCDWDGSTVVAVHNLSAEPRHAKIHLAGVEGFDRLTDLLSDTAPRRLAEPVLELKLEGYGFHWFRLQREGSRTVP